jgi:hypothetical protein
MLSETQLSELFKKHAQSHKEENTISPKELSQLLEETGVKLSKHEVLGLSRYLSTLGKIT